MARNYRKEHEWDMAHYTRKVVKLKPEHMEQLRDILKSNRTTFAEWVRNHVEVDYICLLGEKENVETKKK